MTLHPKQADLHDHLCGAWHCGLRVALARPDGGADAAPPRRAQYGIGYAVRRGGGGIG